MPVTRNLIAALMFFAPPFAAAETASYVSMPEEMILATELDADIERGKELFALCATCHYENALGKADGSFPSIAGQHKSVVIKQMADFRAGNRDNPTMFPFSDAATIGGAQALADVAAYIASMPKMELEVLISHSRACRVSTMNILNGRCCGFVMAIVAIRIPR
ncbi:hypothetical protein BOV91_03640 [Solemya velum gill symbiont]|nr:hypothetical protein BOV91_03640 [Solemya velum gill symbiont]